MAGFFDRMLGRSNTSKGSGATAKDRLKFVLLHERVSIAPEKMREMKAEIIAVITKYVPEIDPASVDIAIEQSDRYNNTLVAQIPFTKARSKVTQDSDDNDDLTQSAVVAESELSLSFDEEDTFLNPTLRDIDVQLDTPPDDPVDSKDKPAGD